MPELPEVEVSRLGISPHLVGGTIQSLVLRTPKLRWPIPQELKQLEGQTILAIHRALNILLLKPPSAVRLCIWVCLARCVFWMAIFLLRDTIMWIW